MNIKYTGLISDYKHAGVNPAFYSIGVHLGLAYLRKSLFVAGVHHLTYTLTEYTKVKQYVHMEPQPKII